LLAAAGMLTAASVAAEPPLPGPCLDRAGEAAASAPARLAQLRYRCLALRNGQRVLVGEAGAPEANTVLLVHGLGGNAHRDWARTIPTLAAQFHVVALDLPGFGGSPGAPQGYSFAGLGATLAEVLDSTAPGQRVHVVGHSLGAAVSLYFADAHPARVDRLVLVDAAGILLKSVFTQHMASRRMPQVGIGPVDRYLKGLDERIDGFRRDAFRRLEDGYDFSRWLAQNPEIRHALLGRYAYVEAALGLVEHDFTSAIRETNAPTTVIWGANDTVAPLRTGRLLAGRMPDARLKVIEGVGHTPMLESPDAFNRLLLAGLTAPLLQRPVDPAMGSSQGSVVCENRPDARYSGVFESITLDHCAGARIDDARMKRLTLKSSSLTLENTVIDSADVALSAQHSEVIATNVSFRGRVAIRAEHSRLDLAGVSLQASERGVEMPAPSRILFSVSEWHGTDHDGDAHFPWPQAPAPR
jgi:pimeloyl-ACP methyl ester carboxylesterase